jgi:thymidylate synthase
MNIRSWDVFLGGSYNLAQYAFLTHMVAQVTGYEVGDLIVSSGNTHLYMNHIPQAKLQLKRTPKTLPTLNIAKHDNITYYTFNDFEIVGYEHHPKIKADISV